MKAAAVVMIVAGVGLSISGDFFSKLMVEQQPMKMAAAEGLYETEAGAPFSILSVGEINGGSADCVFCVPGLLAFLSTGSFDGTVEGINNLQSQYESQFAEKFGEDINYVPYVPVTYWSFRLMIGLGMVSVLFAMWALWRYRGARAPTNDRLAKPFAIGATLVVLGPLLGNSFGWIFTEMGRQPWIVFGEQLTADAVSPLVSVGEVLFTMIAFTLVYLVLIFIEVKLLLHYIAKGAPEPDELTSDPFADAQEAQRAEDEDAKLYFAY